MREMNAVPAWYLTPYILWLGFIDWLTERARLSHTQVAQEIRVEVRRNGPRTLRRIGIGAVLFCMFVLFVAHLFAPAVRRLGVYVPRESVVPASAVLAGLATVAMGSLILRAILRVLRRTYQRGLRVWEHRASVLYEAKVPLSTCRRKSRENETVHRGDSYPR